MTAEKNNENRMMRYKVLLVDDHPLVRRGVADVIAHEADLEICGEADGRAGSHAANWNERIPTWWLVDLTLRSGHGIDLIEKIKAHDPRIKTLVSSMHDETLFAERVLQAGAMGYITKQEPPETLVRRHPPGASRRNLPQPAHDQPAPAPAWRRAMLPRQESPIKSLSNREIEVYEMIGQGLTIQQIAARLHLSPKTVETHREKIKQKLNLKSSTELNRRAVQWVLERGWLTTPAET